MTIPRSSALPPFLLRQLDELGLDADTPPDAEAWRAFLALLDEKSCQQGEAEPVSRAAQRGNDWYRQAVEASPNTIFMVDREGRVRNWNAAYQRMFGYGPEIVGRSYLPLLESGTVAVDALLERVWQGETLTDIELRFRGKDGSVRSALSRLFPLRDPGGSVQGCVFASTDVTERKQIEVELEKQRAFYEHILNSVPLEIAVFDADHRYRFCNPAAIKDKGIREWIVGKDDFEYCAYRGYDPSVAEARRERFCKAVEQGSPIQWEETFFTPGGEARHHWRNMIPTYGTGGELQTVLGYGRDVTELKHAQLELQKAHDELEKRVAERTAELEEAKGWLERTNEQLQHDAFHDALTGLPNRALFKDRLGQAIERYNRRPDAGFAVLFLDFDRFKVINDSLGHAAGDALLVALGERLRGCVRPADTVARLSGDEFTILLEDVTVKDASHTAERVQQLLRRPFLLTGKQVSITVSIGIVPSDFGYDRPEDVLRDADLAMYRAKALGRAGYQLFTSELRERAISLLALETDLRSAVERRELEVHYQPIVSVETRQPVGFEALVRWQHPVHGLVSPQKFIPIAEEMGLVADIDRWVLREACVQVLVWQQAFPTHSPLTLSVNVSGQQFSRPELAAQLTEVLQKTGFDPRHLKLELTEGVLIEQSEIVNTNLAQLSALGVQLHLDDFGTGYSSLSYLQNFPLNVLKIDRSFVSKMEKSTESAELVRTIVALAKSLNLKVTAEGVETVGQLEQLQALGCEFGQGYLFARPLNPEGVSRFMTELGTTSAVFSRV